MHLRTWTGIPPAQSVRLRTLYWTDENPFADTNGLFLARGAGRSYGDVCLPTDTAILCIPCNRIRLFDRERGILRAEAGLRLGELLAVTIPAGWTLPVLPGTAQVTLGGAIANDIHGKSHHWAGTFGRWVHQFELLRSDGRYYCSPTNHAELFAATIGGLGLTGIITWAEIQLVRCSSAWMQTHAFPFASLEEFHALNCTIESKADYVVAWCDLSRRDRFVGIIHTATFCDDGDTAQHRTAAMRDVPTAPISFFSRSSVRISNALRRWCSTHRPVRREHYQQAFFPLDRVPWNRLFGPRGFYQLHAVIPTEVEREGVMAVCRRLWNAAIPLPLCVLKKFAPIASPGVLSFPMAGTSIAIDVPNTPTARATLQAIIDDIAAMGGRIYPAKDALMTAEQFQRMYPQWQQLERWRDQRCSSQFWARVTGNHLQ